MSYQKKYFYTFVNKLSTTITVEIWEDSEITITATEINADLNPAILKYANRLDNSVWSSGAELELRSETDRQFIGLYTNDMLKYQVRIYRSIYLAWCGYLDTENYEEPFNDIRDYPVRLTANDGFALLSRIRFNYLSGSTYAKFEGFTSLWLVLIRVLYKIKLPWEFLYVGLSASLPDVELGADETIFEHLYLNPANYYNEDDEPESCRTVLEEILKPFNAIIVQMNGSLYITDVHYLTAGDTKSFKKYSFQSTYFEYVEEVDIPVNNGDITDLGLEEAGSTFSLEAGINKQIVSYSPYNQNEAFNFDASKDLYDEGASTDYGSTGYQWRETLYDNSTTLNKHNTGKFAKMIGLDGANTSVEEEYAKMKNPGLSGRVAYEFTDALESEKQFTAKITLPHVIPTSNYKLKIEARAYLRTTDDLNNTTSPPTANIQKFTIYFRLKIGDKKLSMEYSEHNNVWYVRWVELGNENDAILFFQDRPWPLTLTHNQWNPVNDKWIEFKRRKYYFYGDKAQVVDVPFLIDIPGTKINGGQMELTIYNYSAFYVESELSAPETEVSDLRFSDFRVSVCDKEGNEIESEDIEYVSNIDPKYMNEGKEIRVLQGTNIDQHPVQRGNLLIKVGDVYQCLSMIYFAGDEDLPENVILKSINSNFTDASAVLECTLPQLLNIGYVTYSNYLPGKKMLIINNSIDLKDRTSKVKLRECNQYVAE